MPELPDIEAYARTLNTKLAGQVVTGIKTHGSKYLNVSGRELADTILNQTVNKFFRNGKELFIEFGNDSILGIHLMLGGQLDITLNPDTVQSRLVELEFEQNYLCISDPDYWTKLKLNPETPTAPDALSAGFNFDYLAGLLQNRKRKNLKAFILDQDMVRGIGNAYADEILWDAKISPESKCGKLPLEAIQNLYASIREVLTRGIEEIVKLSPEIIHGEVRSFFKVHIPGKKLCPHGFPILVKKIASKTTYFTEEQVLYA